MDKNYDDITVIYVILGRSNRTNFANIIKIINVYI